MQNVKPNYAEYGTFHRIILFSLKSAKISLTKKTLGSGDKDSGPEIGWVVKKFKPSSKI